MLYDSTNLIREMFTVLNDIITLARKLYLNGSSDDNVLYVLQDEFGYENNAEIFKAMDIVEDELFV